MDMNVALKPGAKIELLVSNGEGQMLRLSTLVEEGFDGETFAVMSPVHEGTNYPLQSGQQYELLFTVTENKKKEAYKLKVQVMERYKKDNMTLVRFKQQSTPKKEQRRQSFRLSVLKTFMYEVNGIKKELLIKNISETGLRGIIHEKLPAKSKVLIHMDLDEEAPLSIWGEVISSDPVPDSIKQYDLRVMFKDLKNKDRTKIMNYIFKKQSEGIRKTWSPEGFKELFEQAYGYATNRRRDDDWRVRSIPIFGLFTWLFTIILTSLLLEARPEHRYGLDNFFNYYKRAEWHTTMLYIAAVISVFQVLTAITGLLINSTRLKRDGDHWSPSLIINLLIGLLVLVFSVYLISQQQIAA